MVKRWIIAGLVVCSPLIKANEVAKKAVVEFTIPHWISLLPSNVNAKLDEIQKQNLNTASSSCTTEAAVAWEAQEKASSLAEAGVSGEAYVNAADVAAAALQKHDECRRKHGRLENLIYKLDVHSEASSAAEKLGQLIIDVSPLPYDSPEPESDSGPEPTIKMNFVNAKGERLPFTPDVPNPYQDRTGVYHTVLARRKSWVLLPRNPFPQPAWINLEGHNKETPISILKLDRPVFVQNGDTGAYVVFLNRKKERKEEILVGVETMEDRPDITKRVKKLKSLSIPARQLFNAEGHAIARWRADESD